MGKKLFSKLFISTFLFSCFNSAVQAQDFAWMKGANSVNQSGTYGTKGATATINSPGGREGAVSWKDAAGNFWMFGGNGHDFIGNFGLLADLWKYDPNGNQWVWMHGSDLITASGNYGTMGTSTSSNMPGARVNPVSWKDAAGNLWMFGGYGHNATSSVGYMNDLWKYNVTNNQWTWVSGSNTFYQVSNFGTQGTPSPTNSPGARQSASSWTDASGNLWLFGGYGCSTTPNILESLNDLWKYNIATGEWTWVNGSNLGNQNGSYGTQGTASNTNTPGGRSSATTFTDAAGTLWLFGGDGWDANTTTASGLLNDLWKYKPSTNEWTWVKGSNTVNPLGVYGNVGVGNAANNPGGRSGSVSWIDAIGNIWLMGGEGYPSLGIATGGLNDLWKYHAGLNEWTWIKGTTLLDINGNYGTILTALPGNMPGARTNYVNWIDANNNLWLFGGYGKGISGGSGRLNDVWKYTNCFISPITMTVVSKDSILCAGESTSLTATGSSTYLWLNNFSINSYLVISPSVTTTYTVRTVDGNGCRYDAFFTEIVDNCTGITETDNRETSYRVYPNPSSGHFYIRTSEESIESELIIYDQLGKQIRKQTLRAETTEIDLELKAGIYFYNIVRYSGTEQSGKLVVID